MTHAKFLLLVSSVVWGLSSESSFAQTASRQPVGIDFFGKIRAVSRVKTIGDDIFFVLQQANVKDDNYTSDLYQLVDGKAVQLTHTGRFGDYDIIDGAIVTRKVEDNATVFYRQTRSYGGPQEWLRIPYHVGQVKFIDHDRFFFTASRKVEPTRDPLPDSLVAKDADSRYRIFEELPYWSNGRGDIKPQHSVLYYSDHGTVTALTDSLGNAGGLELSTDNRYLVFTDNREWGFKAPYGNHLYAVDTQTLRSRELSVTNSARYGFPKFIDGENLFLSVSTRNEDNPQANSPYYRLNVRTGISELLYDGDQFTVGGGTLSDVKSGNHSEVIFEKRGIVFKTANVDYTPLARLAYQGGKVELLTPADFSVDEYIPYGRGYLLIGAYGQDGQELFTFDGKAAPRRISDINTSLFEAHSVVHAQEISYTNNAGQVLRGFVLPPANREPGRKYPTILNIHGGPKAAYGFGFFHEMQYWASQGYAVIFANPRGSSANGSEFAKLKGDFGGRDYDDLMAFVDAAVMQIDFIDRDRLGVTGGSYGGVMTNWIIGHTDRFKAAASQRSISNWVSLETLSDIGFHFGPAYTGSDIWQDIEALWRQSPLAYADKVKTPTLFIHSDEDYRCPLPEGLQMYSALKYNGVPSRIVIFKGENHELSRSGKPLNRIKRLSEITRWFDYYLK